MTVPSAAAGLERPGVESVQPLVSLVLRAGSLLWLHRLRPDGSVGVAASGVHPAVVGPDRRRLQGDARDAVLRVVHGGLESGEW